MRTNDSVWTRPLWSLAVALVATGLTASSATAATVRLVAAPVTKMITLPNGIKVSVPMWGYALDLNSETCALEGGEQVTVPGPRIAVADNDPTLTVELRNCLPEPTSLVIPGQPFEAGAAAPVRIGGRATSMTPETAPNATGTYTFPNLKPGTFLYQSGSHQAVQIQMGLYGALTRNAFDALPPSEPTLPGTPAQAYAGIPYATEVVLVYSEIDQALHEAVDAGHYGPTGTVTSTVDYRPSLFLINGASYASEAAAAVEAGASGQTTLLRVLNAGLRTHAPVLDNGSLKIVAEDGNPWPYAKDQATVLLAAGKTHDILWTPAANGVYSLYDRALGLNAPGQGSAGMLAKLSVAGAGTAGAPVAVDDTASGLEDGPPITGNVLANDTGGPVSATLVAWPHAGSLTLLAGGGFSYTPSANFFGIDEFSYRAVNASGSSAPAVVTIMVTAVPDAPVANGQSIGVDQRGNVTVTLSATSPDGDALKYYIDAFPTHGNLSFIDPLSKVQTPLTSMATAIPDSGVIYTPCANTGMSPAAPCTGTDYSGADAFTFHASGGAAPVNSNVATVSATVYPVASAADDSLTQTVTLSVVGGDGAPITAYRWTLEEDLTHHVVPGVQDPNTLAVSFHQSYMPVISSGTQADLIKVNPAKRYFVSVLPTAGTYSNGGTRIEAHQSTATVTVANLPLPTARIRVRVFRDNAPLNGAWDSTEPGLAGFQVTIDDAGGTYGMSGGHQSTDAFGNKLGTKYKACPPESVPCESYEVDQLGDGFVLSDADGYAVIENLVMGKYTVKVRAPGGDKWIQTTTIEGQPGIDAWVKPNEPQFFTEFGPPGPHVEVGFTRVENTLPSSGGVTVSGRVTNLRMSRPIAVAQFSGAPFTHTRPWVALNSGATGGNLLYAQPTNADGTFSIQHVPANNSYQIMVFDSALDLIIGSTVVNVANASLNVGDVAVFNWFTNLYAYVFDDANRDGIHQSTERGIADQALNIRFRDGSIYQSLSTAENGFKAFNEVFPFFAWMVAEVDYTRFHSTGLTVAVDAGGDAREGASNAYNWQTQMGLPEGLIPPEVLNPQPQPDNANLPFRRESGAETPFLLLEGFQSFIGQSTVMLWGKAPYEKVGTFTEDVNVAPFDDFPGPGDTDNGDRVFNTDRSNGGIAGIIHYGITRAENDPRWAAAENWEPGVSDVRVQLWDENRTHLLNEVTTDNWNNSVPEGCVWPSQAPWNGPYIYRGQATDCFDGLRNFNQARPALFDGGYAFSTILQKNGAASGHEYDTNVRRCDAGAVPPVVTNCRDKEIPLPAGKYVVKIIVPPGYKLQKEEDKNVDFGDSYVPQQFWLTGYPLADGGGPGDAQPAPTVQDNALIAPFCVGQLHLVPPTLSLFPGEVAGTFAGEMRPLCDAKLVTLREGQQAAPDFHLFTEAPVAGHVYGMVLDDTTNEFDPNAPTFGEKYAVPFIGVAIRDWQGREITRTYTDQYGMYNALVPSSYTANPPEPSGVSPSILAACINPPTMPGPGGTVVADPNFQKQYSHFCYPLQYLAGKTTYLDTPVVPTGAFTGNGTLPVDAEFPDLTPVIASVTGPNPVATPPAPSLTAPYGPYIVDRGTTDNAARTIMIASAANLTVDGLTEVANPAFDGAGGTKPKLIKRDYGFGASGSVLLNGQALSVVSWTNEVITATVPSGLRTGQLVVVRGTGATARRSTLGVTLSVATPAMHLARAPKIVNPGQSIQAAIDTATPGDLILVKPGVYQEMVIMTKPVRLQGAGASTTAINVVTTPAEQIQTWLDRMGTLLTTPAYLLPNQPAITPAPFFTGDIAAVVGDEGPGVMVLSKNDPTTPLTPGWCRSTTLAQPATNFATPANEAYCLHNENYAGSAPVFAISGLLRGGLGSGGGATRLITVTTPVPHGYSSGNQVLISGINAGLSALVYNGTKTIAVPPGSTNTFTYTVPNITGNFTSFASATVQLVVPQTPVYRPNARIDGFSLIGASNAPGVLVNGYAHYLEVSNNKVYTNSGTYAGGVQLGHAGAAAPFNDEDAHNDNVSIHNNMITQNAAIETGGGGGVVLGTGSTSYSVKSNFIAGNFTAGNGGGIAHIGRSELGVIDSNTVIFNESFVQSTGTNGGGLFIGGTPAAAGASTPGSGEVSVTNNLIQGNAASGGDGGGIALLGFASSDRVRLYNNMIANNVAGLAGGGVSIEGVPTGNGNPVVDVVHDTIVNNDSTGTAGAAFGSPLLSTPQPAGISGRGSSMSRVRIANSIVRHNRTFYFGPCTPLPAGSRCGIVPVSPTPGTIQYAEIQTGQPYWDLANLTGSQFSLTSSVLTSLSGPSNATNYLNGTNNVNYASSPNTNNIAAAPLFVSQYFNTDRRRSYEVGETTGEATLISVPAALDEGGNFIRPQFGPLSLENPNSSPANQLFGNYHVTSGVNGATLCSIFGGSCTTNNLVPPPVLFDFDGDVRPPTTPHRGADQASGTATPPTPPTLTSISPTSGGQGATVAVTLTGTNLATATAVNVSGTEVACGITGSPSATTVNASCIITASAPPGARQVTVATAGGTTNTVTFTVTTLPPTLTSISPTSGVRGTSGLVVTLAGTNLAGATAVNVSGSGVTCSVGFSAATSVLATCNIAASATLSSRNVTVTTPGGTSNSVTFSVVAPALTSISPTSGVRGTSGLAVTLTGTNLAGATAVNVSGSGVTCRVSLATATSVLATCDITAGATLSSRNVTVTAPGGTSNSVTFTVLGAPPGTVAFTSASFGALGGGTLAFGILADGTYQSTLTLTVADNPVQFGNVTVTGGFGNRFSEVNGGTCQNQTVQVGNTCTVIISFNATGTTNRTGGLSVPHNGTGSPLTLVLTGQ